MALQPTPPEYLSLTDAARRLAVSRDTLRRRIADGSLRAVRLGPTGTLRVAASDLRALASPVPANNAAGSDAAESPARDPLADHVAAVVAGAPHLSPEQLDCLAGLLAPVAGTDSR